MSIVKELKAAIARDGRSINALARDAGLSPIQLSRFIRGTRGLHIAAADALADALGLVLVSKRRKAR